jgi:mono/diheme cytochrome c family protein
MESRPRDPQVATDGGETHATNRRVFEFLVLAGLLGLGTPIAVLMGVNQGNRTASVVYSGPGNAQAAAVEAPAGDFTAVVMGRDGDEAKGKAVFQSNCVACHGPAADGKGPAAAALTPPPRNFLDPAADWTRGRELMEIYGTVSDGIPGTSMIGFSATLSVEDRWALVHYLSSLPGVMGKYLPMDEAIASSWRPGKAP